MAVAANCAASTNALTISFGAITELDPSQMYVAAAIACAFVLAGVVLFRKLNVKSEPDAANGHLTTS
jgi:hypothetical protein